MSTPTRLGLFLFWNPKTGPDKADEAPGSYYAIGRIAPGGLTVDNQTEIIEHRGPEAGGAIEQRMYAEPRNYTPIITARLESLTAFEWSLIMGDSKVGQTGSLTVTPGAVPSLHGRVKVRGYNYAKAEIVNLDFFACAKSDPMELSNQAFGLVTVQFYVIASTHNAGNVYAVTA